MADLFAASAAHRRVGQPLAERMRPRTLAEFVGQRHLLGQNKILSTLAAGTFLPSAILWGPPGCGKTTLARLCGNTIKAQFVALSAVDSGVKDLREAVANATRDRDQYGKRTLLFIDEIHRFSKTQQDALLPHVEAGTITLLGATTENPSFGVVAALLSRCKVIRLEAHSIDDLLTLADAAITDPIRGLGAQAPQLSQEVREHLVHLANGDARRLLNLLEQVVALASAQSTAPPLVVNLTHVDEAAQQKTLVYDRAGDEHYGVVSAFIKSMRGSDPHAAMYWMTRMLEAGEDPRFILRRMVIFASEDIGNADPQAIVIATAALHAFELMGLPEGALPLTQAATYLALAPKSNRVLTAYAAARKLVLEHGNLPVPGKLRNVTNGLAKAMGHGDNYKYPHDFAGHYVPEDYLPDQLIAANPLIYQPSSSGFEQELSSRLAAIDSAKADRKK